VANDFDGTCAGDAGVDDTGAPCFGSDSNVYRQVCPGTSFVSTTVSGVTIDTATDCDFIVAPRVTELGELELCGVAFDTVNITQLAAIGPRPLLIFARTLLSVEGEVDVASHVTSPTVDPAGVALACEEGFGVKATGGAGGSAGGSFGTQGGKGGAGNGAQGGLQTTPLIPTFTRGGCAGTQGGDSAAKGGIGGRPGGAIYFMSPTAIHIASNGRVNASGAGALSADLAAGGGGGGSGGMIVLDAPSILIDGVMFALGGGGSSGGSTGLGGRGNDPTGPGLPGAGGLDPVGAGGGMGGTGAPLSPVSDQAGPGTASGGAAGGGGGGGGIGIIRMSSGATLPPPTTKVQPTPLP